MNQSPKYLIKLLEENGFIFKRAKGSHQIYYNPIKNYCYCTGTYGSKDIKKGTFLAILKQAGIIKTSLKT